MSRIKQVFNFFYNFFVFGHKNQPVYIILILLIGLSYFMHQRIFNLDLMGIHVWRQTHTQINIINFTKEDFNIFNPRINNRGNTNGIHRLEFPFMQWCIAGINKATGYSVRNSRYFSFITGFFSILGIFFLTNTLFNHKGIATLTAWAFNFSPVFYYYTLNPLPDNLALCLTLWSLFVLLEWKKKEKMWLFFLGSIVLSLAALVKLPFIIFYAIPCIILIQKWIEKRSRKLILEFFILSASFLPIILWYYVAIQSSLKNNIVISGIFEWQNCTISVVFYLLQHNLISTLPELLLNYGSVLFFLVGLFLILKEKTFLKNANLSWTIAGLCVILYFLYELNTIAKVHDYYLFPFLPFLFIIVGYGIKRITQWKKKYLAIASIVMIILVLPITAYLRADSRWNLEKPGFNVDFLKYKQELTQAVADDALCIVGNDESGHILFYYIGKKGWCFDNNDLSASKLNDLIHNGARYLYSDSRSIDDNEEIKKFLKTKILEIGTVRVYELQE